MTCNHMGMKSRQLTVCGAAIFAAVFLLFMGAANGNEQPIPDKYSLEIDNAAKQQLGEQTFNEVMLFFHNAENAIETRDLAALMSLYSDNYSAGDHDKRSAEQTWQRIFATFDRIAMLHKMKFGNASTDRNMVTLQCTGLLVGVPGGKKEPVTIDNWTNQDHILVKEGGKWKLIGTYGLERKRLWFDEPMHPLF